MLDGALRRLVDRPLDVCGRAIARHGIAAEHVTLAGFAVGLAAAGCIAAGWPGAGLALILINRAADGLDGAVARATAATDRGGFLDIALDFAFYATIPLAFAVLDPARNALPAATLLASFVANSAAFLASAIMAEKRGLTTAAQGEKSLYYVAGLAGGFETIAFFVAFCLWPQWFPTLAIAFASLCALSAIGRVAFGWRTLR